MRMRSLGGATVLLLLSILLVGCQFGSAANTGASGPAAAVPAGALATDDSNAPMPAANTCTIQQKNGNYLPDPKCTPGAVNPAVTQATIGSTICRSGWTATIRPPSAVTGRMKKLSDTSYGLATSEVGEYDHLISLELGGAPDDPRNLWVEPGKIPNPKDAVENKLSEAVCSNLVPLTTAQQAIAADWTTAIDAVGLGVSGGKLCLRSDPSRCATAKHGATGGE
jgi:hypothetical protein